jgi:hypothetical protein
MATAEFDEFYILKLLETSQIVTYAGHTCLISLHIRKKIEQEIVTESQL